MTTHSAKCILASQGEDAPPVFTMEVIYPLPIHAEVMTHRALTKNSASLRAIPTKTVISRLREDPFVPVVWGKNEKGMQSTQDNDALVRVPRQDFIGRVFKLTELVEREEAWLRSMESAIIYAEAFADAGYHKQVQNRLLAPYLHNRVLITGVNWQNFMDLRVHKDAEPHINILAKKILEEMNRVKAFNEIKFLKLGEWHTPYVSRLEQKAHGIEDARKVSVARSARVSYNLADGRKTSFPEDLELYERLAGNVPVHASPLEHILSPDRVRRYNRLTGEITWNRPELHGNTPGYIQFRKTIPGETSPEPWLEELKTKHQSTMENQL